MSAQLVSQQTQRNWWIATGLLATGLIAAISGVYFLAFPSGGYQGGRNPYYGIQILFSRQTWDDLHTWGGVAMIVIALIHLVLHWSWVTAMARRTYNELRGRCGCMNARGRWNLILNLIVAVSFVLTAVTGVYLLFVPGGRWATDPMILFSRNAWDLIHTWAGVAFISAAMVHFAIHWKWFTKVSNKMVSLVARASGASQPYTA